MPIGRNIFAGLLGALTGYLTLSAVAAYRLMHPYRRFPQIEPSDVGLHYEDIWLRARDEEVNLAAWHIPAENATRAIIFVHGMSRCRGHEFTIHSLDLVAECVESGYTVVMLELRGHGESDAAHTTYGLKERRDILGAVDWLLARGYAPGAIGVLGASIGAVAAIGAASEEPAIGGLLLDSAFAEFSSIMQRQFQRYSKLPDMFLFGTRLIGRWLLGEDITLLRPVEMLESIKQLPMLIIHGENDELVPVEHARALAMVAKSDLVVIPEAGHLEAYAAEPRTYTHQVIAFFNSALTMQSEASPLLHWQEVGHPTFTSCQHLSVVYAKNQE